MQQNLARSYSLIQCKIANYESCLSSKQYKRTDNWHKTLSMLNQYHRTALATVIVHHSAIIYGKVC